MDLDNSEFSRFYLNPYLNNRYFRKGKYAVQGNQQITGRFLQAVLSDIPK